jgi:hypothetical protein
VSQLVEEQPALAGPATPRALAELVQSERQRQDARLTALRRLRGDAAALVATEAKASGIGRAIAGLFTKRKKRGVSEEDMRARYEDAQLRARRAAAFAESLAALQTELSDEVARLGELLVTLARDEKQLDALLARLGAASVDVDARLVSHQDGVEQRELERDRDRLRSRVDVVEALRKNLRDAEDRLLGLVEGERMLVMRLAALRKEVEGAAQEAGARLDAIADRLRALAAGADAQKVVAELEDALGRLMGSLESSAKAAESVTSAASDPRSEEQT